MTIQHHNQPLSTKMCLVERVEEAKPQSKNGLTFSKTD
jgi:hypothetical protein